VKDSGLEGPVGALGPSGWGGLEGLQGVLGPDFDWPSISEAVKDSSVLATLVVDYLGLGGKERKIAREIIGEGDQEAERVSILLMAMQIRDERNWRWRTFWMALAGLIVAVVSLIISLTGT